MLLYRPTYVSWKYWDQKEFFLKLYQFVVQNHPLFSYASCSNHNLLTRVFLPFLPLSLPSLPSVDNCFSFFNVVARKTYHLYPIINIFQLFIIHGIHVAFFFKIHFLKPSVNLGHYSRLGFLYIGVVCPCQCQCPLK